MDAQAVMKYREVQSKIDPNLPQQEFVKLTKIANKVSLRLGSLENKFIGEDEFAEEMKKIEEVDFNRFMSRNPSIKKIEYGRDLNAYSIKVSNGTEEVFFN